MVDYTFNSGTKFDSVRLETKKLQYLYNDGADFWLHGQRHLRADVRSRPRPSATPPSGSRRTTRPALLYAGEELISIEPQMFVELEVTETEPGFKGDTATNTTKPATLETGTTIQVPTFVEIGDVLQIDTRDGRFVKRV